MYSINFSWPDTPVLQPGCSATIEFRKDHDLVNKLSSNGALVEEINSTDEPKIAVLKWLSNSEIMLEVATGEQHLIAEKSKRA